MFSLDFFRAKNIYEALYIIRNLFTGTRTAFIKLITIGPKYVFTETFMGINFGVSKSWFWISIVLIIFMELIHLIQRHGSIRHMLNNRPTYLRWLLYYAIILSIIFLGVYGENQFIYFQF